MEEFIRESRMVMLGFYVDDLVVKERANEIIENSVAQTMSQLTEYKSVNEIRARNIDAYYEMGTRYFKRYASMNWRIFLTPNSLQRFNNIQAEIAVIEEVIYEMRSEVRKNDRSALAELGHYLMTKVRLDRQLDMVEHEMLNIIESHYFKDRLLPDVVRHFYNSAQSRK